MISNNGRRKAARAILSCDTPLSRKAGSFLGQCVMDDMPLTERQSTWFEQLAEKAGVALEAEQHAE